MDTPSQPAVGLAEPDHTAARGQRSTRPERTQVALPPGCRVVALGGRRDATPCPPNPVPPAWWPAIPEVCLPGEGMSYFGPGLRLLM